MAEQFFPFDGGTGASITEAQWSYLTSSWQDNGVEAEGPWSNSLQVSSLNANLTINVAAGHAFISGFHYYNDATKALTFVTNAVANPRKDRVVLRLDKTANTVAFVIKQGTAASTPVAPTVDRTGTSPEISIATIVIPANSSAVPALNVTDERDFIGRRVQIVGPATPATLPEGTVAYRPSDGVFLLRGKTDPPSILGAQGVPHTYSQMGAITVATGNIRVYNDSGSAVVIKGVRASVGTAPTGAAIIVDVNLSGTTLFTTQANRPTIAASAFTSGKVTNMNVISWPDGGYLTVDIDQVGSTVRGSDLSVQIFV